jgi:dynein heavy chain
MPNRSPRRVSRSTSRGDKELSLSPTFQLFLQTKLSNPHYPPEIQAECTLINFTVTESGLEDQLLSLVVQMERPDLAASKEALIQQSNQFKIQLQELEKGLLQQLADADSETILENIALIESLEGSKKLSTEIKEKVEIAKVTEVEINTASEFYRPAACRGALVFFLMNELYKIHSFYKFSLDSFLIVVRRAITIVAEAAKAKAKPEEAEEGEEGAEGEEKAEEAAAEDEEEEEKATEMTPEQLKKRVDDLTDSITYQGFNFTRRGTLEDHKLIISTMLCFRILIRQGKVAQHEYDALIKKELAADPPLQAESLKFLPETAWAAVKGLENLKIFENLSSQMEGEALLWRKWYIDERPESIDLPKSVANISLFHRTLLLRAMRPDRLTYALREFVNENMGIDYVEQQPFDIVATTPEMNPLTPTFFVLFPGVNPVPEIETIAKMAGKTEADGSFIYISMGQG